MELVTRDLEIIKRSSKPDNIVRFNTSYKARKTVMVFDVVSVALQESDLPLLLLKLN
jgi:hypothetical protein